MSKVSGKTHLSSLAFDYDVLRDILSARLLDFELAVSLEGGKVVGLTPEFGDLEISFIADYIPSSYGSWEEPPSDTEVYITEITDVEFRGIKFDISTAISDKGWEHMDQVICDNYQDMSEPQEEPWGED